MPHNQRHIHLRQKETFEVEQGVLGVEKNGVEYVIKKGDGPVSIAPGVRCVPNFCLILSPPLYRR